MKILLTGASGFIGKHLLKQLYREGHEVKKISRSYGHNFMTMTSQADWLPLLNQVDIVINCVGIIAETRQQTFNELHTAAPIVLFNACVKAGVKRVIQVSALGADEQAFTPYQLSKRAADDVLRTLPLDWFILRPSLVYGKGGTSSRLFKKLASLPLLLLPEGGRQNLQPVFIDDLIETITNCLTSKHCRITLNIVGAHPIIFSEFLQTIRTCSGKPRACVIPVPYRMAILSAKAVRIVSPLFYSLLINEDNLRMLHNGNVSDVTPMANFNGHMPLDLKTGWSQL